MLRRKNKSHLRATKKYNLFTSIVLEIKTFFEGRKLGSTLAKYGRSKEKRNDAKLVVLALVANPEGFIKYSSIMKGNMADPKTLEGIINKLRIKTSVSAKKALVLIDAGISTDSNLLMIKEKGYDYICVSRSNLKSYSIQAGATVVSVTNNKKQKSANLLNSNYSFPISCKMG